MKRKSKKVMLFEMMSRLDPNFKPLNEEAFNQQVTNLVDKIKNDPSVIDTLSNDDVTDILMTHPEMYDLVSHKVDELDSDEIYDIIKYSPELAENLKGRFSGFSGESVLGLWYHIPELRGVLGEYLYKVSWYDVIEILRRGDHNTIIEEIKPILQVMDKKELRDLYGALSKFYDGILQNNATLRDIFSRKLR
jgi:hypothetical protein